MKEYNNREVKPIINPGFTIQQYEKSKTKK